MGDWLSKVINLDEAVTTKCPKCGGKYFRNSWHNTEEGKGLICTTCNALCEWSSVFGPIRLSPNPRNVRNNDDKTKR